MTNSELRSYRCSARLRSAHQRCQRRQRMQRLMELTYRSDAGRLRMSSVTNARAAVALSLVLFAAYPSAAPPVRLLCFLRLRVVLHLPQRATTRCFSHRLAILLTSPCELNVLVARMVTARRSSSDSRPRSISIGRRWPVAALDEISLKGRSVSTSCCIAARESLHNPHHIVYRNEHKMPSSAS